MKRIAYFGPAGTFTEEVALAYDPTADLEPFSTINGVATAVETGMCDEGVVPIENSIQGSVSDTLDLLIHDSHLAILRELVLPVVHYLLARPGVRPEQAKVLYSHPQALGQCRRFIEQCLPRAQTVASLSTASAVQEMMASPTPAVAIGTKRAAALYGAEVLATGIQDRSTNETRFVVLAPSDHPPTGNDKTSLCFSIPEDRPGGLCNVLQEFADANINLTKIESRPSKESLGKYIFLVDAEGHRLDPVLGQVLERVQAKTTHFKVFGSYPRYQNGQ